MSFFQPINVKNYRSFTQKLGKNRGNTFNISKLTSKNRKQLAEEIHRIQVSRKKRGEGRKKREDYRFYKCMYKTVGGKILGRHFCIPVVMLPLMPVAK